MLKHGMPMEHSRIWSNMLVFHFMEGSGLSATAQREDFICNLPRDWPQASTIYAGNLLGIAESQCSEKIKNKKHKKHQWKKIYLWNILKCRKGMKDLASDPLQRIPRSKLPQPGLFAWPTRRNQPQKPRLQASRQRVSLWRCKTHCFLQRLGARDVLGLMCWRYEWSCRSMLYLKQRL